MDIDIELIKQQARQQSEQQGALAEAIGQRLQEVNAGIDALARPVRISWRNRIQQQIRSLAARTRMEGVLRNLWSLRFMYQVRRDLAELYHRSDSMQRDVRAMKTGLEVKQQQHTPEPAPDEGLLKALSLPVPVLDDSVRTALINGALMPSGQQGSVDHYFTDVQYVEPARVARPLSQLQNSQQQYEAIVLCQGLELMTGNALAESLELMTAHLKPGGQLIVQVLSQDEGAFLGHVSRRARIVPAPLVAQLLQRSGLSTLSSQSFDRKDLLSTPAYWQISATGASREES